MIKEVDCISTTEFGGLQSAHLTAQCAVGNVGLLNVARALMGIEPGYVSRFSA